MDGSVPWAAPGWSDTTPLDVVLRARPALERVPGAVGDDAGAWLAGEVLPGDPGERNVLCDLRLRTGPDDAAWFHKSAIVTFGLPRRSSDGWQVPMAWRSATLAPLFPVFEGYLEVQADRVALHGRYAPPGRGLGRALDGAILHMAARATARWFLRRLTAALE